MSLATVAVTFSSFFLSSHHFSPTAFCISSLQLLFVAVVLHSPSTLPRSLLTQSSNRIVGLSRVLFPPHPRHLISANFSSPIPSTCPARFNLLLHSFILKLSFAPTSALSSFSLLLSAVFTPKILIQVSCKIETISFFLSERCHKVKPVVLL